MKKSNKVIAVVLSLALLLTAVGGTIAWLTDKDKAENVFSVGSVDIQLKETNAINDTFVATKNDGKNYFNNVMPGDTITKTPVITNVGKNDAYVRVIVEVENKGDLVNIMNDAIDEVFENKYGENQPAYEEFYDNIFNGWGISYLKTEETGNLIRFAMDQRTDDAQVKWIDSVRVMEDDYWQFNNANKFMSDYERGNATGTDTNFRGLGYFKWGGESYYKDLMVQGDGKLIYAFYLELKPNESYTLFNGFNVPEEFDTQSLAFFDGLEVNIYADAIQAQGFDNWTTAIDTLNKQHSLANLVAGK